MTKNILVIFPHPDDEAFSLSGTLAQYISEGAHVTYACLTLGEMGRNMGVPPFANRVTLPAIRKEELEESCRIIGIQDLRMLGFHDKMLEFEDKDLLDSKIKDLIDELQPTLIMTFHPEHSVHPDHNACGAAVVRTVYRMPADQRPPVYCVAFSKNHREQLGLPDVQNDVRGIFQQKMASIAAHRSQAQSVDLIRGGMSQEEIENRLGIESFYTYPFE